MGRANLYKTCVLNIPNLTAGTSLFEKSTRIGY
jgi:uncharacterized protein (DUF302 family)